jgi:hypothetical protein
VGSESKLVLAIRTIVVTTRVAIRSHRKAGTDHLGRETARRGAAMLAELGRKLPADGWEAVRQAYEEADREMQELRDAAEEWATAEERSIPT